MYKILVASLLVAVAAANMSDFGISGMSDLSDSDYGMFGGMSDSGDYHGEDFGEMVDDCLEMMDDEANCHFIVGTIFMLNEYDTCTGDLEMNEEGKAELEENLPEYMAHALNCSAAALAANDPQRFQMIQNYMQANGITPQMVHQVTVAAVGSILSGNCMLDSVIGHCWGGMGDHGSDDKRSDSGMGGMSGMGGEGFCVCQAIGCSMDSIHGMMSAPGPHGCKPGAPAFEHALMGAAHHFGCMGGPGGPGGSGAPPPPGGSGAPPPGN